MTSPSTEYGHTDNTIVHQSNPYYGESNAIKYEASQDQEVTNETAAALFQSPINTPGDALHLLLEASGRTETLHRQSQSDQGSQKVSPLATNMPVSPNSARYAGSSAPQSLPNRNENIDPAIAAGSESHHLWESSHLQEALQAWSRLRFIRAGWFTAREAISYIE